MRKHPALFCLIVLLPLIACGDEPVRGPGSERAIHPDDVPLVFIPGLMGSILRKGTTAGGETRWLTVAQSLGLSTPDLRLPLGWQEAGGRPMQARDDLRPAGALLAVKLPGGLGQEVYAPWIEFARRFQNRPLHVFAYDWRRDNGETADRFEAFLGELQRKYGGKKIQVVAHSMGGMITLAVWNHRPDLIDRVVFAGVPFRGGIGYLDNMFLGTEIALNDALLGPDVIFSHTSVYSFYPAGASFENTGLVRDENGAKLDIDFYDVKVWQRNAFGPFARESAGWFKDPAAGVAFLKEALRRCRAFRDRMRPTRAAYPPALVLSSKSRATLRYVQRLPGSSPDRPPVWDFDTTARVPGDGSVTYGDSIPPAPIEYEVVLSDFGHSYLLNDPAAAAAIESFLTRDAGGEDE